MTAQAKKSANSEKWTALALRLGIAVPFLYFGIQIVAFPFFPAYSFLSHSASMLGSDASNFPAVFNIGSIITGTVTIVAAWGFLRGLTRIGVMPLLAWIASIAVFLNGIGSIWAGLIPLPNHLHAANPFVVGVFLTPLLVLIALWTQKDSRSIKTYLIVDNLVFLILITVMSGLLFRLGTALGIDMQGYQNTLNSSGGLLQRIVALVFFPPIGIAAYFVLKRIGKTTPNQ